MAAIIAASIPSIYKIVSPEGQITQSVAGQGLICGLSQSSAYKLLPIIGTDTTTVAGVTLKSIVEFPHRGGIVPRWYSANTVTEIIAITNS